MAHLVRFFSFFSPPSPAQSSAAGYVDDRACKECHEELYQSYQSTGMARSFYPAEPSQIAPDLDKPYYHEASRRHYVMTQRGGKLVLKRYCLDEAGGRFAELESEVADLKARMPSLDSFTAALNSMGLATKQDLQHYES